jgi:hypothetical protein
VPPKVFLKVIGNYAPKMTRQTRRLKLSPKPPRLPRHLRRKRITNALPTLEVKKLRYAILKEDRSSLSLLVRKMPRNILSSMKLTIVENVFPKVLFETQFSKKYLQRKEQKSMTRTRLSTV